jgi:hypothetical protein
MAKMTEAEWLESAEPDKMLVRIRVRPSHRKCRLFAVACCRRLWPLFVDERSRTAVEVAERHAEGKASDDELRAAAVAAGEAHREMFKVVGKTGSCIEWATEYAAASLPFQGARNVSWMAVSPRCLEVRRPQPGDADKINFVPCAVTGRHGLRARLLGRWKVTQLTECVMTGAGYGVQAELLRCIFGNPFRPAIVDPSWLTWNAGTVVQLAETIYAERRFGDLPVLADALEEAGCANEDILNHCRAPGEHARGCWVVDLLLGKQ